MKNQILALAKHLDIEYFEFAGEYYTGSTIEDFNALSGSNYEDIEEICLDNEPFKNWLDENCTLLIDEITEGYSENVFEAEGGEYIVCDNDEADLLWDESIESYIDDCVLNELPEQYRQYFDNEKFKHDCSFDGRGHTLASYDGHENKSKIDNETYYIYRVN